MKKPFSQPALLFIILLVFACHANVPPSCDVARPLEELPWLKAIVADTVATRNQSVTIYQATYRNRTVYQIEIIPGPDAGVITLHNCKGYILCRSYITFGGLQSDCQEVFDETTLGPLLYTR